VKHALFVLTLFCLLSSGGCLNESPKTHPPKSDTPPQKPPPVTPIREKKAPAGTLFQFTDIAKSAGVDFQRDDDMRGQHRILEANGGGAALFDFDGDGRLDIVFTSGCRIPLEPGDSTPTIGLFRNLGRGKFQRVTESAALLAHRYYYGCAAADFDNDGFDDLYVTAFGRNSFWRNNGDGTFSDITDQTGTAGNQWSSSAAFADLNGDGVLDLYVTNYVQFSAEKPRLCPEPGSPDGYLQCTPTIFRGESDVLYLGDGTGGFRDVTVEAGITAEDGKGLGVVIFDTDGDGLPDIFVANDGMPNFLYVQQPGKVGPDGPSRPTPRFIESAALREVALDDRGKALACMGIACGDYNADGRLDLYVTNFYAETNTLYRNEGQGFRDATPGSGAGASTRLMTAWGTEFCDFDNDGRLDLFVANGHVDDFSWRKSGAEPYQMTPQLFRNDDNGRFTDVSRWGGPYFRQWWLGRGTAVGDLDDDGDLDVVVSHQKTKSAVLRNDTKTRGRSVILKLVGRGTSNRSAFGTRVEAMGLKHKLVREVIGGGSYQSSSDRRVHIGLGQRDQIPVLTVLWPSGRVDRLKQIPPGSYVLIEGRGCYRIGKRGSSQPIPVASEQH
jgi:hypothetical protein